MKGNLVNKEKQQRFFQRVKFWVMLFSGASFLAVATSAFGDARAFINSENIEEVRQAVPWAIVGTIAASLACYALREPFDIVSLWLGQQMRRLKLC